MRPVGIPIVLFALAAGARADERVGPAVALAPPTAAAQPDLVAGADGTSLWMVYGGAAPGQGDVYVVRSVDGGATFGDPVKAIDAGGRGGFGMQRGPRLGRDDAGTLYVTAALQREAIDPPPRYPKADLWLAASTDGGATWGTPVKCNDAPEKTAAESMHALAVSGDGVAHVVWLDTRGARNGNQLWYTRVRDQGRKVEPNRLAYASPDGTICPCCAPALAVDRKGNPVAAFRNAVGGARDGWIALSRDGGKSFIAAKVGRGSWPGKG